jgi:hypothetical protein
MVLGGVLAAPVAVLLVVRRLPARLLVPVVARDCVAVRAPEPVGDATGRRGA